MSPSCTRCWFVNQHRHQQKLRLSKLPPTVRGPLRDPDSVKPYYLGSVTSFLNERTNSSAKSIHFCKPWAWGSVWLVQCVRYVAKCGYIAFASSFRRQTTNDGDDILEDRHGYAGWKQELYYKGAQAYADQVRTQRSQSCVIRISNVSDAIAKANSNPNVNASFRSMSRTTFSSNLWMRCT